MFNIKKRFFTRELKRVEADIWSVQFTIFAAQEERESFRQQVTIAKDLQSKAEERMKADPKNVETAEEGRRAQKTVEQLQKQIAELDGLINGVLPPIENLGEQPQPGLKDSLESKQVKKARLVRFIKEQC